MPDYWLEVSIRKVLQPATSAQVFLGSSIYKRMLRWFSRLQVATARFSCSPPDLNFLDPYFIFMYMHYNHCNRATAHLQLNILLLLLLLLSFCRLVMRYLFLHLIKLDNKILYFHFTKTAHSVGL